MTGMTTATLTIPGRHLREMEVMPRDNGYIVRTDEGRRIVYRRSPGVRRNEGNSRRVICEGMSALADVFDSYPDCAHNGELVLLEISLAQARAMGNHSEGVVAFTGKHFPGHIFLIAGMLDTGDPCECCRPLVAETYQWRAPSILVHEFGHLHHYAHADDAQLEAMYRAARFDPYDDNRYANKNRCEAYAEAFTSWHMSGGNPSMPEAPAYAQRFGWSA